MLVVRNGVFSHQGEHGFGGGEEFGLGDVADDLYGADAGGQDEGERAAAVLLVAGGEGYELCCGCLEGRERPVAENKCDDVVGLSLRNESARQAEVCRGDGTPADAGLALGRCDHPARGDLRLGALDRGGGAQAGLVACGPGAVEADQRRAGVRPHDRLASLAAGADQDRCAPECAVTPICCNTFSFDICNMIMLFRRQDGESALESSLSPLR